MEQSQLSDTLKWFEGAIGKVHDRHPIPIQLLCNHLKIDI